MEQQMHSGMSSGQQGSSFSGGQGGMMSGARPSLPKKKVLSKREIDVLYYIKEGMKNPEIAAQLNLSTKTVENHVRNILLKLGVKNRTQAVVHALKASIIPF